MVRTQRIYGSRLSGAAPTASSASSALQRVLYDLTDGTNPSVLALSGYYNQAENILYSDIAGTVPVTIGTAANDAIASSLREPQPEQVKDAAGVPQYFSTILNYAGGTLSGFTQPALGASASVVAQMTSDTVDPLDPALDQIRVGTRAVVGGGTPYTLAGAYQISAISSAPVDLTLTFTAGSADIAISAGSPLIDGMSIQFGRATGDHPGGFTLGTPYYVVNSPNANAGDVQAAASTFQLAGTLGGAPITVTTTPGTGDDFVIKVAAFDIERRSEAALQAPAGINPVADGAIVPADLFLSARTTFDTVTVPSQTSHIVARVNVSTRTKNIVGSIPNTAEGRRASAALHGFAASLSLGPSDPNATTQVVARSFADSGFHLPEGTEFYLPDHLQFLEATGYNSDADQAVNIVLEYWAGDYTQWSA